jgi:hypothetical protein
MALRFSPMGGKDATEPRYYDATPQLEAEELLTSITVVSQNDSVLTISSEGVTTELVTKEDGTTIGIGKGVTWINTVAVTTVADVDIKIALTGDGNTTIPNVIATQPVVKTIVS